MLVFGDGLPNAAAGLIDAVNALAAAVPALMEVPYWVLVVGLPFYLFGKAIKSLSFMDVMATLGVCSVWVLVCYT